MNGRHPIGIAATSPQAIQRARVVPNEADCASVLDQLVNAGKLDEEAVNDMLMAAMHERLYTETIKPTVARQLLTMVGALIEACDNSTDQSTLLQGAKARAYTAWVQAGGAQ